MDFMNSPNTNMGQTFMHCQRTILAHDSVNCFPITRRQNYRLIQIETNCRQHFKVHLKWKISTIQGRKHCEKRRNCLLQAISPFLTMFSTAIYLYISMPYCVVMGLQHGYYGSMRM